MQGGSNGQDSFHAVVTSPPTLEADSSPTGRTEERVQRSVEDTAFSEFNEPPVDAGELAPWFVSCKSQIRTPARAEDAGVALAHLTEVPTACVSAQLLCRRSFSTDPRCFAGEGESRRG